jgi:hypothetical protein
LRGCLDEEGATPSEDVAGFALEGNARGELAAIVRLLVLGLLAVHASIVAGEKKAES